MNVFKPFKFPDADMMLSIHILRGSMFDEFVDEGFQTFHVHKRPSVAEWTHAQGDNCPICKAGHNPTLKNHLTK